MMVPNQKPALAEVTNGSKTPVYFDRQVIRASDLTLDRESHDKELERMRRYLHGWGIVVGFEVHAIDDNVSIKKGYGVTPNGAEVFLPYQLKLNDISLQIWACCGPAELNCDVVSEHEILAISEAIGQTTVGAWLIARPMQTFTEPRPGVPDSCAHPASTLLPSRACDGVRLELLCELPATHVQILPDCDVLAPYLCGPKSGDTPPYLSAPQHYTQESEFLVLAKLTSKQHDGKFTLSVERSDRKTLLPNWVLQQFMSSCICPLPTETSPIVEEEVEGGVTHTSDSIVRPVGTMATWEDLEAHRHAESPYAEGEIVNNLSYSPNDGYTDPSPAHASHQTSMSPDITSGLIAVGINGPQEFLRAEVDVVVAATGMTEAEVLSEMQTLAEHSHLFNGPRY